MRTGTLELHVFDDDGRMHQDDFLGCVRLQGETLRSVLNPAHAKSSARTISSDDYLSGLQTFELGPDADKPPGYNKFVETNDKAGKLTIKLELFVPLKVHVLKGSDLPKSDKSTLRKKVPGDPYVRVMWNQQLLTNARNKKKDKSRKEHMQSRMGRG